MSEPGPPRTWDLDPLAVTGITPEQARCAALEVARRFADQPELARELLAMLGLLDLTRRHREPAMAPPSQLAQPKPTRRLVDTAAAAEALHVLEATLHRFADARILRPARTDPNGTRWWHLADLRAQLSTYLDDDQNSPNG